MAKMLENGNPPRPLNPLVKLVYLDCVRRAQGSLAQRRRCGAGHLRRGTVRLSRGSRPEILG